MAGNHHSIRLKVTNKTLEEQLSEIVSSLEGFDIQNSGNPETSDLLVLEIGDDLKREFQLVHDLQASGAVKEVFLTSARSEPEILIRALRAGAKEFLSQPIKKDEAIHSLLQFKERNNGNYMKSSKKQGKVVNVIGSKGGIGTTTVAVNFATNLVEAGDPGHSVALIDLNLLFGDIPLFLDIESTFNWGQVARNISRLDATYLMSILSRHPSGIYILPSPTGLDGAHMANPDIIKKLLSLMKNEFKYIIIDSGQSLNDISMKVLEMSDIVLLNTILSMPCLTNVKRLLETFKRLGYPLDSNVKIVVNRYHKKMLITIKEAEKGLQKKISWTIPNDFQNTMSAINQGKTLAEVSHRSEIAKNIRELAIKLIAQADKKKEKKGLFRRTIAGAKI